MNILEATKHIQVEPRIINGSILIFHIGFLENNVSIHVFDLKPRMFLLQEV